MNGFTRCRWPIRAGILGLALLASACGATKEREALVCPKIVSAPDAARVALFAPGGNTARDVTVLARIESADNQCTREGEHGIKIGTEVNFRADRSRPTIQNASVPYFIAVVDAQRNVVAQESFQLPIKFLPAESYRVLPAEKITTHLPLRTTTAGAAFTLIVGFQLTPEQLAFNRSQHTQ